MCLRNPPKNSVYFFLGTWLGHEEDSPYPEVRSAVANFDDPNMHVSTIRSWTLGLLFSILIPGMNQFFHFRYPSVNIGSVVAQLIAFPIGSAWARCIPDISVFGVSLNPGPFTIKEHVLVTIMAGVGSGSAYATDVIAVQKTFYEESFSFGFSLSRFSTLGQLVVSTQCIGFSIGGITRRFLVSPPSMIWPNTLVACALFNTLHSQSYAGMGKHPGISRERFFLLAFFGTAIWYFVPGYLFQALSWVIDHLAIPACWIAPENIIVNQLFGYRSGLGFSVLTFDWNQIAYIGVRASSVSLASQALIQSLLATPWWSEVNVLIGFVFFYCESRPRQYLPCVVVLLPYSFSHRRPYRISSISPYDNTGNMYNHSRIIKDGKLDLAAYKAYSPLYLSTTFAMSYGLSFMSISATIVHAIIHFWAPMKLHFRRSLREQPDVHAKLMMKYPEASRSPDYYYACIFVVTFIFACVCIECWDTGMTIWALILALCVGNFITPSVGMIQAITNWQIGLNVITELLVGFILPGTRPFKVLSPLRYCPASHVVQTYGYITMSRAIQFTADFKLGHYMKIPPRPMFWSQVVATLIAGWGLIGPGLFISKDQVYFGTSLPHVFWRALTCAIIALIFFFIIGAVCPILLWLITRRRPNTILNYLRLIFSALGNIPPATAINFIPWAVFGFIFQFIIRRKHFAYWTKYNYVLSAALDAGTAVGLTVVFFCLQYPLNGAIGQKYVLQWWGNTVFRRTLDWQSAPLRTVLEGETFG
ncbi:OPT oligopeptide transporter protein-domain-containing protein [Mycena sp. CBHHK59/15]|nr:OPT oligopeptide transporter protein-domain-containing protein [Mycena sp. CBHHK59/15]